MLNAVCVCVIGRLKQQFVRIDGVVIHAGQYRECAAAPSIADQFHFLGLGPFTGIRRAELDPTVL